jgi:hypothetical protein
MPMMADMYPWRRRIIRMAAGAHLQRGAERGRGGVLGRGRGTGAWGTSA